MKCSFITGFLLVEFFAILDGSALWAQEGRRQMPVVKDNFTNFTRTYTNRGKLWMERNKAFLRHPDANFADGSSPNSKSVELFAKRTIDTKFYINKDSPSVFYAQWSSSPMHFKRNGQWITIDTRLNPKGPSLYEASNQEAPLGFDIKRRSSYILTTDGRTYFNNWKLYGENGSKETLLATADWTNYTAGDDGIVIKNIFPGVDAEMRVLRGSIKTNFIVHANRFSSYKTLLLRDSFLSGRPGNLTFPNGRSGNGLASSAEFRVSAGTTLHIKEGVMYQKQNPSSTYQSIPYNLDHNKLTLVINGEFLSALVKTGDVIIDPLVQDMGTLMKNKISGSHSNQDCSLDTACEYDFKVPAPQGATLTDAMFSFEFTANAPCVGQDGAFSFTINGRCTSKMWVGTAGGTGPQNFPNQSILLNNGTSLAACFPVPDCDRVDIPFTFNFFRKCHGPDGCDGSCIEASKDLKITLVGRTFDSASLSASPQNTCAGGPVTLTARGYYGVPPYNFTWLGLPQFNGDSVIQVNPNLDAVYTVQINDACKGHGDAPILKLINVNVSSKPPTPAFTSNSPVCTGGQLILTVPSVPGITYSIKNPNAGLGGSQYAGAAVFDNVTAAYSGTWIAVASGANGCSSDTARTTVVINPTGSPTFDAIGPLCQNSTNTVLPPKSKEGISGTWSPAIINTSALGTTAYKFTPSSAGKCSTPVTLNITIVSTISPTFPTIADSYCQNATVPLLPPTSNEGVNGIWSPASINTATVGRTLYTFTPATSQCGKSSQIAITINPLPALNMGPDLTIAPGASTTLNPSVTGNIISYLWSPSRGLNNATIKNPVASPSVTTVYSLDVTDNNKCEVTESIKVTVSGTTSKILVPNAFSPNGDGINDTWIISNLSAYSGATVDVFNRYGQPVFHSDNYNKAWDGTFNGSSLPMGTYYYIIDPKNNEKKIAGSVTLFK